MDAEVLTPSPGPGATPVPDQRTSLPATVLHALDGHGDWLSSWWTVVVLAVLGGILVTLTVRAVRRHRRGPAWLSGVAGVLTLVLASAAGVNTHAGYLPDVAAARTFLAGQGLLAPAAATGVVRAGSSGRGAVRPVTIPVPASLKVPVTSTWVYTPPGFDPSSPARYPVVYLVHGEPGTSADWFAGGQAATTLDTLIDAQLIRPMIVVAPDVNGISEGDTECLDSTRGGPQVETYLTRVVVPWVDSHLPTRADWGHRAIGGMSSGGYCAMDQGLRHPELFGTLIGIEPYADPGAGGRAMLATPAQLAAHDVASFLPTMTFVHPVAVFIDVPGRAVGRGEARAGTQLVELLRRRGQTVEFRAEPGQTHTWTMARVALPYALQFASEHLAA